MKVHLLRNIKIFFIMTVLIGFAFVFSACTTNPYDQMEILLSNNGKNVTLYLQEGGASTTEDIIVQVVGGGQNINRQVNANAQSDKLAIDIKYNESDEKTILVLRANGTCKDVLVTVNSKEGGKSASFYVSVEIPIEHISQTSNKSELYAVRGGEIELKAEKLLNIIPSKTTQRAVNFSLHNSTISNASIEDGVLMLGENFNEETIEIMAVSAFDNTKFAIVTLDVLEPINNIVDFSAFYGNTATEIDLENKIEIAKNTDDKNSAIFNIVINSTRNVNLETFVQSTLGKESRYIGVSEVKKSTSISPTRFEAMVNAESENGADAVFFIIKYSGYNYQYVSPLFNIETYDVVKDIEILVDNAEPDDFDFVVYYNYFGVPGLKINATVSPTTVPNSEKTLILQSGLNADEYRFFNNNGGEIVFKDNKFEFESGENIFIKAKTMTSKSAQFKIFSKSNSEIEKNFNISSSVGATELEFSNAEKIGNKSYYYLTSNQIMEKEICFTVDNTTADEIAISGTGNSYKTDSSAISGEANSFSFFIESIQGKANETGTVTILLKNGLTAIAYIEVFTELEQDKISFSIPTSQYNPAIGKRVMLSETIVLGEVYNLEFNVALQKDKAISLRINANSPVELSYQFYDFILDDETSVYDETYEDFNDFAKVEAGDEGNYESSSSVLRSIFLNFAQDQIYANEVGKCWVKTEVKGFALEDGVKSEISYDFYFLVEVYIPVKNFLISNQAITLYALNSVGDENYADTYREVSVALTGEPTYNKIEWENDFASFPDDENLMTYSLNNEEIFTFEDDGDSVTVSAFSTLQKYEHQGETIYEYADSRTFYFIAKVREFDRLITISLKVIIKKAVQVEQIIVENLNVENGIYIELDFESSEDLFYQIIARADNGTGNPKPFNDKLIFTFINGIATPESLLSIDNNGVIKIGNEKFGGTGTIRIAPADRFINSKYIPGEFDVAVYIQITVADGRSRGTAYRITNFSQMSKGNSDLHYILMNNITVPTKTESFAIFENFNGGLYGSVLSDMHISTITTDKSLFKDLGENAIVEDLIVCGNIENSYSGFIAETNNGTIKNVTIDTRIVLNTYNASGINAVDFGYVGGIVGENNATIYGCNFYGKINAPDSIVGGIAGRNSGNISHCTVELYNFENEYATLHGGSLTGGVVGAMNGGSLTYSYIYSYVSENTDPKNYMDLEILQGGKVGGLVGILSSGVVDICFAYVNDIENLIGEITSSGGEGEEPEIINAYIIYNTSNSNYDAKYTYNGIADYNYQTIVSKNIWQAATAGINKGFPYFKSILQEETSPEIGEKLNNLKNLLSIDGKSVIFYYKTNSTLNNQEVAVLNAWNTISFNDLLGIDDSSGIRAVSSNSSIITPYSNGILIKNCGGVKLTLFSKYDYSISKEFTIYVVYPILNFSLENNGVKFGEGTALHSKINKPFSVRGSVDDSVIFTNKKVLINTDSLKIIFQTFSDYIQGGGLSNYAFDTQEMYEDTSQTEFRIEHTLNLNELSVAYAPTGVDELNEINLILSQFFENYFTLKLFKGADDVELSNSAIEIEPIYIYEFEAYVFSDIDFVASANGENGECLGAEMFSEDDLEIPLGILDIEINGNQIIYYIGATVNSGGDAGEAIFIIVLDYLNSIYYLDAKDRTQQTLDPELAVYFQHKFNISVEIGDKYKNYSFDEKQFILRLFALTSKKDVNNSDTVYADFNLTVKSQTVSSVNVTHFALERKTSYVENSKNVMHYNYEQQSNSVLTPGSEGLLSVDVYPIYADYDYLEITYEASEGDHYLRMTPMSKATEFSYIKSSQGFTTLPNGIQINNKYKFQGSIENSLASIYISTFVPETIDRDLVFVITIKAFDRNGKQSGERITFNLVIQYLSGATVQLQNNDGEEIDSVVRGATENLIITVNIEQSIASVNLKGRADTPDANNLIYYSDFAETINGGTKTYRTLLHIGTGLILENNSNFFTIEVTISWVASGKLQTKTTVLHIGVMDFEVEGIELRTDKSEENIFSGYIGIQSSLLFDFIVKDFITPKMLVNPSLQEFYKNSYYKNASGTDNAFDDYIVNMENEGIGSFIGNLFYVDGSSLTQVRRTNGTIAMNDIFTFSVVDGVIKITGKRSGSVSMLFSLPVKLPSFNRTLIKNIDFYFTINIEIYSDEDSPLIIDSEEAFYSAVTGENPQNYILMTDLYLLDYSPSDTGGLASLDGNNFVINILSWNQDIDGNVLQLAMFNNVVAGTTLKNLIINVYHASSIVVDTTRFSNIEIAGLAINNYGIIYNCHVTAFESDFTRPKLEVPEGINVGYSIGQIDSTKTSKIAGFVLNNSGLITNSRVGGKEIIFANAGAKPLLPFNIVGQGDIAGFVYDNSGSIASSYFDYGTILNKTSSGTATFTTGFVGTNSGNVHLSYSKGVGSDTSEVSLSEAGINTANVSAGFAYTNRGEIGDCFSNILLTSSNDATKSEYSSGRLTSGFVYDNQGLVERCYTASKIEDAKTTQMNFVGGDNFDNMKNSGFIRNSYYYNMSSDLDDVYARADINISVRRITEPDLATNFYGFTFANSMQELNGVWHITNTGPELVSANQIAVSSRYLANEKYDDITGELVSYALPYHDNYEYGSKLNPIIIRNAIEFNKVFGGDHQNAGSAISRYYDLDEKLVFGNYRIVSEIDLSDLITDDSSGVKVNSSNMTLSGGMVDGNKFVVNGLELVAKIESTVKDYGMFAALKQDAIIMNMRIEVIGVSAVTAQNVGAVAGTVENSKLINIYLFNGNQGTTSSADVVGNNIVGGIVGKVVGTSELKNLQTESINAIANHVSPLTSQRFNRNETPLNKVNSNVSYAGGIAGVADIYKESAKSDLKHNDRLKDSPLAFLYVKGNMHIYGSAAGGIVGYLGPQTLLRDVLLELSEAKNQKLLGYNFSAGGIVGQCYGDIDMARAEHEYVLQSLIENSVQAYYKNPSNETIERGNLELFEHDDVGKYEPKYIGGIVGELITGNISHSYSKIPVRNTRALYAGGIAGAVTFAENESINNINLIEVYTFSDAFAVSGVGGFAGYIEQTRTLSFHKVNLVNYWSLCKNESNQYYMPEHYYDIYAATGTRNQEAKLLNEIVNVTYNDVKIKENYLGKYDLPIISHEEYSEDIYVISKIIFDSGGANQEVAVEKSCARLASLAYIEMIDEYLQSIIPLYEYEDARTSGSVMDTYFVKSGWDPNYWKRYTNDMLPRLISIADVNIFYIVVAEDLLNIVYYPDATFIVIGKDGNGIVKCGDYIRGNNLDISNFSGVLKGYDNSGDYGFDFQNGKQTFIQSTEAGAKIYNLMIKNLGSNEYQEGDVGTLVGTSRDTEFENLNFVECSLNAYANSDNSNIGLLCGHIRGGYISNISFEDCKIDVRVQEDIMTLNVGLMAGLLTAPATGYMQIADISAYLSTNNASSENLNSVRINVQGYNVFYVNTGTIAGKTEGAVYLNYTSKSIDDNRTRNLGVSETPNFDFKPDTASGETKKGMVIEILGTEEGIVGEYNAGIGFGRAGVLNLSHQRADAPLVIGGVIVSSGQATIKKAVVGGYIGKSMTSSAITSNVGVGRNYMYIDCDLEVQAENVTAGMLIGEAGVIYSLRDVDTYGTINVTSTKTSSFVGGMVGVLNSDLELRNSIVHTVIDFKDELSNPNNEAPAVGGFIGMVSSSSVKIKIGEDNYKTKYLGTMTIDSNKIYAGGIIGAFNSSIGDGAGVGVKINSAVFGGEIIINSTKQAFVGGIVGSSLYEAQTNECSKTIESCFVYGNIYINETFDTYFGNTYAGGVIGRGSPATEINSNDCISTIYTKYTQVDEILTVNALVGETNGAFTGRDIVGDQLLVNNYSHQMSLCLDNSGIAAKNIYYKRNVDGGEGEQDSMLDIVQDYISQLDGNDMERQVYEGSKLNPFEIKNSTYGTIKTKFETDVSEISPYAKIKYFVISENLSNNLMSREKLSSSHLIGDGFSINTNQQAVFSIIDENSTVTGFKVKAQIESTNSTTLCEGTSYYGGGAFADINKGFVYSCNVSEQQDTRYGYLNSSYSAYVGGLIGINTGYVADCFASLDIAGASTTGGFVGINLGTISHSYSNGSVSSSNSYAFGYNNTQGGIYYSYSASITINATVSGSNVIVYDGGGAGVFGGGTVVGGFYDVFAVDCSDSLGTADVTDRMAVYDEDNILADFDESIEGDNERVFLINENKVSDTATIKFGYDYQYNNGYLTFIGSAYADLDYMQDNFTGNGSEDNPIEVTNIGKFQQLGDASYAYNYVLVRDIALTPNMENAGLTSEGYNNVVNWKAIGSSSAFSGTVSGYNNGESFKIRNIQPSNTGDDYCGIFGNADGATIQYLDLNYEMSAEVNSTYIAGLLGAGKNVNINNIIMSDVSLTHSASSGVCMGAIAGEITGDSVINDCSVNSVILSYSSTGTGLPSYLGGLVGKLGSGTENSDFDTEILRCEIVETVSITYDAVGGGYAGGVVGAMLGTETNEAIIYSVTVGGAVKIENKSNSGSDKKDYFGGITGRTTHSSVQGINLNSGNTFENNIGNCYMGGMIGEVGASTEIATLNVNKPSTFKVDSTSINTNATVSSYIGGNYGKIKDYNSSSTVPKHKFIFKSNNANASGYVGGIAGELEDTKLTNVNIEFLDNKQVEFNTSAEIYFGGFAGAITGTSELNSCRSTYAENAVSFEQEINKIYAGGMAGKVNGDLKADLNIVENFDFSGITMKSNGVAAVGGMIGIAEQDTKLGAITVSEQNQFCNLSRGNIDIAADDAAEVSLGGIIGKMKNVDTSILRGCVVDRIIQNVIGAKKVALGGIVGDVSGNATFYKCEARGNLVPSGTNDFILKYDANEKTGTNAYIGGIAGKTAGGATPVTISNCSIKQNFKAVSEGQTASTEGSYIGGVVGDAQNTDIEKGTNVTNFLSEYLDSGKIYMGGIIGHSQNSNIRKGEGYLGAYSASILSSALVVASAENKSLNCEGYTGCAIGYMNGGGIFDADVSGGCVVVNGATSGNSAAGGVVGYAANNSEVRGGSYAKVSSYSYAGGIVGKGNGMDIKYSECKTGANVYAGQSNTININVRGIGNVQYDFKDANGTPYAGGIIAYATNVGILECHNHATVSSGYYDDRLGAYDSPWDDYGGLEEEGPNAMSTWWDGRSETITKDGTNESYAGGIVGYALNTTVNDSNNYASIEANAKQDLTIECVWYKNYGIIYGEHKLFSGFAKERSYASGIANIDTSSFLQNCQNDSQVSGGYEVGFNYVYNTPYGFDPLSQKKFYLLHYGISYYHRQEFNNLCYLYSWNVDIRDEIIATGEIYGMMMSGSNDNYTFTNTNVFYGNQVCNNPSNVFTTVTLGGLDYKYYYTSDEYGYAGGCSYTGTSSTVCTYSSSFGGTTKSRATLPSLFYPDNEPENIVEPILGDEERITWQEIRSNDWMLGVYQYTD